MEEEPMDALCESVPTVEIEGLDESEDLEFTVELAQHEDGDDADHDQDYHVEGHENCPKEEISIEMNNDEIEISQNNVEEEVPNPVTVSEESDDGVDDTDPTETLQKVLMDQKIIPIKQEPFQALLDMKVEFESTRSTNADQGTSLKQTIIPDHHDPSLVKKTKTDSAVKKLCTTTSSEHTNTFDKLKLQKRVKLKESGEEKESASQEPSQPGPKHCRRRKRRFSVSAVRNKKVAKQDIGENVSPQAPGPNKRKVAKQGVGENVLPQTPGRKKKVVMPKKGVSKNVSPPQASGQPSKLSKAQSAKADHHSSTLVDGDSYMADCLVCNAPNVVIKKNVLKRSKFYPFCLKCKNAYIYQRAQAKRHGGYQKSSPRPCQKENKCEIDFRDLQNWCTSCHLVKFNQVLSSLENAVVTPSTSKPKSLRPGPKSKQIKLMRDALQSAPSVLVKRMTREQLAQYGIATEPPSIKQEPMDYEQHYLSSSPTNTGHQHITTPSLPHTLHIPQAPPASLHPAATHFPPPAQPEQESSLTQKSECDESWMGIPVKNKGRRRKILMTTIPSDSSDESQDETGAAAKDYFLPKVNVGHEAVFKKGQKSTSEASQGNENNFSEVLDSIKVYVFTCGHACGLCNSLPSKKWLKESGFYTAKPILSSSVPSPHQYSLSSSATQGNTQSSNNSNLAKKPEPSKQNIPPKSSGNIVKVNSSSTSQEGFRSLLKLNMPNPKLQQQVRGRWITLPVSTPGASNSNDTVTLPSASTMSINSNNTNITKSLLNGGRPQPSVVNMDAIPINLNNSTPTIPVNVNNFTPTIAVNVNTGRTTVPVVAANDAMTCIPVNVNTCSSKIPPMNAIGLQPPGVDNNATTITPHPDNLNTPATLPVVNLNSLTTFPVNVNSAAAATLNPIAPIYVNNNNTPPGANRTNILSSINPTVLEAIRSKFPNASAIVVSSDS